ncbi:cation-translocating P-type ATPase [Streptococcus sp. DD12]|uniref:cation-translocating P-type ATPase n=1 Tax=Streptococcus sp. DD12 TaxID=1777880 RepID=UPI000798ABF5|nr:cation-translocating P-type ATPase [Streptococcus sp. DD12]KXT76224.1 Calcium-transporting ATPase [Streptococcus sp. DD12]
MSKEQLKQSFFAQDPQTVLAELDSTPEGLSQSQAQERLQTYGANELEAGEKRSLLAKFIDQFKDLMIIILLIAAALSVVTEGMHGLTDAIIILVVVILNAAFGVYQEGQAEAAIEALKDMSSPMARVRRDGQVMEIDSKDLVPGDIVLLEAGDVVPADMRLLEAASLKIEEAALTGESVPVEKDVTSSVAADAGIGDRLNMAYQNANVTYGRGVGLVTNTGMYTEVGHIAGMLADADETDTPLKQSLNNLSKALTYLIVAIAAITFVVGVFIRHEAPLNGLMTAVALAVAAIPEGLPAIVTVVLSLGTQTLAKRHSIVRSLPAVETLGSTEIIASDKTGTLTQNQMTVEKIYYDGAIHEASEPIALGLELPLLRSVVLANDTKIDPDGKLIGDPTETAFIQYALSQGFDVAGLLAKYPRVAELPFDSDRKLMSTIHQMPNGQFLVAVKGAPDQLLKRCVSRDKAGDIAPIDAATTELIQSSNRAMAHEALRVLAGAYKVIDQVPDEVTVDTIESDLIFTGMIGMIDPERPEAAEAVRVAKEAGIRPIMITGDHQDTAEAIAKRLGIIDENDTEDHVFTGAELNELTDEEFQKVFKQYSVYARVSPEHKVRIVKAWQNDGKVVAMTGDGVNDAPSLKTADIGIGMGITGTEVSKGASDMVLADDNFATIIVAVEEGRKVFSNIQKSIQYLLSANMAEVFTIFFATLFGWDVLQPVHLLWINLVTDTLPAIALGVEPAEPGVMTHKPRGRKSSFFSGGVLGAIIYQGILQTLLVLGVYGWALLHPEHQVYKEIHADALTMAFATLGLIQLVHAFNVKSVYQSIFTVGVWRNKLFNWAIPLAFLILMVTIVVPGFNQFFHVSHLSLSQWLAVFIGSFLMLVLVEIVKAIQRALGYDKKAI